MASGWCPSDGGFYGVRPDVLASAVTVKATEMVLEELVRKDKGHRVILEGSTPHRQGGTRWSWKGPTFSSCCSRGAWTATLTFS